MVYDDDEILTDYVWHHCVSLMTRFEQLGHKAAFARVKANNSAPPMAKRILEKWGAQNDPEVVEALSKGVEHFKLVVRDRVLRDNPGIVNRCPKCSKICRTPRAKQCRWCMHDWH